MSPVLAGRMGGENPILSCKLFHAPGNNSARYCLLPDGPLLLWGLCRKKGKVKNVMLNLFQHRKESNTYETLK